MLRQVFENKTVLEAAQERISFIFDSFESIVVSVSGGKDSTVLAHLALVEANKRGRQIGLFLLDEEVLYQSSVDQVEYLLGLYPENTKVLWLQVPFNMTNAVSVEQGQLACWEPGAHKIWMRPKRDDAIKFPPWGDKPKIRNKNAGFGFYDVIENFEATFKNTAFLIGLRAIGESLHRFRACARNPITVNNQEVYWGTERGENKALYPIYDWHTHDVWKYIAVTGLRYSKTYDLQFKKGYSIYSMRVSSVIHERGFKSLTDLQEFEPKTYARLLKRVKGVALAQETGRDAKLFRCRKLPKNFKSWRTYRDFLIATHPDQERIGLFTRRFATHFDNEYVARQQCRQLILNDYENNLHVDNAPDPRDALLNYYEEVL